MAAGAPVDDDNDTAMGIIHYVALTKSFALLRAILAAGANADALSTDAGGASALHFCLSLRESTVMLTRQLLIRNRAISLGVEPPAMLPLLREAAEISEPLKQLHSSVTSEHQLVVQAKTIREAIYYWQLPLLITILSHSHFPESLLLARDFAQRTALHIAAKTGNMVAIDVLFTQQAAEAVDAFGRTPLHLAAMAGHFDVIKRLKQLSSSDGLWTSLRSTKDNTGRTYKELLPTRLKSAQTAGQAYVDIDHDTGGWSEYRLPGWSDKDKDRCDIVEVRAQRLTCRR